MKRFWSPFFMKHSWHFNWKIKCCYFIHNNVCSIFSLFIVLLFLREKFGSEMNRSLSVSRQFLYFCLWYIFIFALVRKWNISSTYVESPYLCIQVLRLYIISRLDYRRIITFIVRIVSSEWNTATERNVMNENYIEGFWIVWFHWFRIFKSYYISFLTSNIT